MLERMKRFKGRRSSKSPTTEVRKPETQFAKVDIPESSMGNNKKTCLGRPVRSLELSPSPRRSTDQEIAWHTYDRPTWSPVPSLASDRSDIIRSPSSAPASQLHYQIYGLPELAVSGGVSPRLSSDSFDEPHQTLDTSTSFLLDATPPRIQRRYTESAAEPDAGLKALFEKPIRLRPDLASSPSEPVPLQTRPDASSIFGPPLTDLPYATPDTTSHRPLVSESSTHKRPSNPELRTFQVRVPHNQPLLILTPPQAQSSDNPAHRLDSETGGSTQDEPSPSQKIALAQVFMYQARMTNQPTHETKVVSAVADDNVALESKASGPRLSLATKAEARRPRSVSTSSIITKPNSPSSYDRTIVPRSLHVGSMAYELDGGRNVVDSETWRKQSRILQLDSFNDHTRMIA
ncbi:hypothetical protein F4781DRAFT_174643 [Annulohypoxylon bovei var. microspora]|nr:hypothetical protein F4781DRAFT_174643 [Annulohypoxylon bovei var. microspora]